MYEDSAASENPEEVFDYRELKERGIIWAITVPGTTKWLQKVRHPLKPIATYPVTLFRRLKVMSIPQAWFFCYPATLLLIPLQKMPSSLIYASDLTSTRKMTRQSLALC